MSANRRRRRGRVETIEQATRWGLSWRHAWVRRWDRWQAARDRCERVIRLARGVLS